MVNYRYVLDDIEQNHAAYMEGRQIAMSAEVKALVEYSADSGNGPLSRLGLGLGNP